MWCTAPPLVDSFPLLSVDVQDAGQAVRMSSQLLKSRYPEDHPLVTGGGLSTSGGVNLGSLTPDDFTPALHSLSLPWRSPTPSQVVMCLHRMGMICAASGEHRAAVKLLQVRIDTVGVRSQGFTQIFTHL